jgi:hypothetical protein
MAREPWSPEAREESAAPLRAHLRREARALRSSISIKPGLKTRHAKRVAKAQEPWPMAAMSATPAAFAAYLRKYLRAARSISS